MDDEYGEMGRGKGHLQGAKGGGQQEKITELSFGEDQNAAGRHQKNGLV
jgi:hypothetical protein